MSRAEPSVDRNDLQALVRGFRKQWTWGRYYYVGIQSDEGDGRAAADARSFLCKVAPKLTSWQSLEVKPPHTAWNVAFSFNGLRRLGLRSDALQSFPADFRAGMVERAQANGDVGASAPEHWPEYWRRNKVDCVIAVYATEERHRDAADDWFRDTIAEHPLIEILDTQAVRRFMKSDDLDLSIERHQGQAQAGAVLEHFGFRDGVSQPVYAGLDARYLSGGGSYREKTGWRPLATGELLLGYPDEAGEMPLAPAPATLAHNGTFMVLRKMRQNVDEFRRYLTAHAQGLDGVDADLISELMVGRKRDGTPLMTDRSLNDFTYADDPTGSRCPLGSHARRANPRDTMGFDTVLVDRHRILRRAITYGEPVPRGCAEKDINGEAGQGLLFIALNASITRQFEFVQQEWINFGNDLGAGDDRDPLIGVQGGSGQFIAPGDGSRPALVCAQMPDFVVTEGGEYLFLPGIMALKRILAGEY